MDTEPKQEEEELSTHDMASVERYKRNKKVGEGTYAVVYEGIDSQTNQKIAIKKIKLSTAFGFGLDISAIRELKYISGLSHPNIIPLLDVYAHKQNLNLVLPFYETDLQMIIHDRDLVFTPADIKSWMLMLLRGLEACHQNNVLHRDIKPNNLLICGETGLLKLADFGLARSFGFPVEPMTCPVVTRWYRSPEILLGSRYYTPAIDIWSAGCVFAELMLRLPFMAAETDMEQLKKIYEALGTPSVDEWPGMTSLPCYYHLPPAPPTSTLRDIFNAASDDAIDLLRRMFIFDPAKRITAREALSHAYFANLPRPTPPASLPRSSAQKYHKAKEEHQRKMFQSRLNEIEPRKLFSPLNAQ